MTVSASHAVWACEALVLTCVKAMTTICLWPMASAVDDTKTLREFYQGDRPAFLLIQSLIRRSISRFRLRREIDPGDIEGQVIEKLLRMCSRPNAGVDVSLAALVATIVRNTLYNELKKLERQDRWKESESKRLKVIQLQGDPLPEGDRLQLENKLLEFWEKVDEKCQRLFRAMIIREDGKKLGYRKIGELLPGAEGEPRSEGTIKWGVSSCRDKARKIWKDLGLLDQPFEDLLVITDESGSEG